MSDTQYSLFAPDQPAGAMSAPLPERPLPPKRKAAKSLPFTGEQLDIITAPLDVPTTKIEARAGTGKSTVLTARALHHANVPGAYLVYNTANQVAAKRRMPDWIDSRTFHSLAWHVGQAYQHKLRQRDLKKREVIELLGLERNYAAAGDIIDTIKWWLASADDDFPTTPRALDREILGPPHYLQSIAIFANRLWTMMTDTRSPAPITHDAYFKMWALSHPRISFPYIMLDEAQDANACSFRVFMEQDCPRVFVGDSHQGIYGFRGASDLFERSEADQTFYLTQSFRFGPRVAEIASSLLSHLKGDDLPIIGAGADTKIGKLPDGVQRTVICRTNAEVFFRAAAAVQMGESVSFVGSLSRYGFDRIHDCYRLYAGERADMQDAWLRSFSSFDEYEEHSDMSDDVEGKRLCKIVRQYEEFVPGLIDEIKTRAVADIRRADRVFSTAHRCKGFDLDWVLIGDDFTDLVDANGEPQMDRGQLSVSDINLAYVVATRAVHGMELNPQLASFGDYAEWSFLREDVTR